MLVGVGDVSFCILWMYGRVASFGMDYILLVLANHIGFGNFGG